MLVTRYYKTGTLELKKPPGPWHKHKEQHKSSQEWKKFKHLVTKYMYSRHGPSGKYTWTRHRHTRKNHLIFNVSPGVPTRPPQHAHKRSLISSIANTWNFYQPSEQLFPTNLTYRSPKTTTRALEKSITAVTGAIQEQKLEGIAQSIKDTTAIGGADGSQRGPQMTYEWAIEVEKGVYAKGHGRVPARTGNESSTQAESRGRAAILANIIKIAIQHNIKTGAIKICIDNKLAMTHGSTARPGDGPFKHLQEDHVLRSIVCGKECKFL